MREEWSPTRASPSSPGCPSPTQVYRQAWGWGAESRPEQGPGRLDCAAAAAAASHLGSRQPSRAQLTDAAPLAGSPALPGEAGGAGKRLGEAHNEGLHSTALTWPGSLHSAGR